MIYLGTVSTETQANKKGSPEFVGSTQDQPL
jgi:hypothetical protein